MWHEQLRAHLHSIGTTILSRSIQWVGLDERCWSTWLPLPSKLDIHWVRVWASSFLDWLAVSVMAEHGTQTGPLVRTMPVEFHLVMAVD